MTKRRILGQHETPELTLKDIRTQMVKNDASLGDKLAKADVLLQNGEITGAEFCEYVSKVLNLPIDDIADDFINKYTKSAQKVAFLIHNMGEQ